MLNGSKAQILVVDDEPGIRETLGMLLTSAGYDVVVAENGVSAISHLDRTVADLMLTDLNMPGMSGMDLISRVRRRYPATLIVAISGDYQGYSVPTGITADRYYPKGQHPLNLLALVASMIESQSTGRVYDIRSQPGSDL